MEKYWWETCNCSQNQTSKEEQKNCLYMREWNLKSYCAQSSFQCLAIDLLCLDLWASFRMRNKKNPVDEDQSKIRTLWFSCFPKADFMPYLADTFQVPKDRKGRSVIVQRRDLTTFSILLHVAKSRAAGELHGTAQSYHLLFISWLIRLKKKTLYIVMLFHLFDITKIEVLEKNQYKLKANTETSGECK